VAIAEDRLSSPARFLLGGAVALALLGLAALELTLDRTQDEPTHAALSPAIKAVAGLLALVTFIDLDWNATTLLALLLALQLVPMGYGIAVWYRSSPARAS